MITRAQLIAYVREWSLREDVVEKDYVLGWLLWAIGTDAILADRWVFKGGTCLKKCYVETYRFSEDLDFTVLPGAPMSEDDILAALRRLLDRASAESGLDLRVREPILRTRPGGRSMEGRIYYRGPRGNPEASSVKIDLSLDEVVARPPVLRPISHPYADPLPPPGQVRTYSFEEVFAEKLRAMGERGRPRDLYDIVNLYWRADLRARAPLIKETLIAKCASKGVPVPTVQSLEAGPWRSQLETEWANMLGHQLPVLPEFAVFWAEMPALFAWLEGAKDDETLPSLGEGGATGTWTPPATAWTWRMGVPFESIRFAGANRLVVELGYHGTRRLIEPYSLRQTRDGNFLLHALRADSHEHRAYRIDQITSIRVTTRPFRPRYRIEFTPTGRLMALPVRRTRRACPRRRR